MKMAILKTLNCAGKYTDVNARYDVIHYIMQPYKTHNKIIGGEKVNMLNPALSMETTAELYNKNSRTRLRHFTLSFHKKENVSLQDIIDIATAICFYIVEKYEVVYALHEDTSQLHIHFVFNTISYIDGYRYKGNRQEYYELISAVKGILHQYGILILKEMRYIPNHHNPYE